jgi:hypothetical protein
MSLYYLAPRSRTEPKAEPKCKDKEELHVAFAIPADELANWESWLDTRGVYLQREYLPEHNQRFRRAAARPEDYHRRAPRATELDRIFRLESERTVSDDWVVRYDNRPPVPNALFGTPRTVLDPRQFQFAAKFSF